MDCKLQRDAERQEAEDLRRHEQLRTYDGPYNEAHVFEMEAIEHRFVAKHHVETIAELRAALAASREREGRLVRRIIAAGDALVDDIDTEEAYHQLYMAIADAGYDDGPGGRFEAARRALLTPSEAAHADKEA